MRDRRRSIVAVGLALVLSACAGEVTDGGTALVSDPRSTADVAVAGGGSLGPILPAELADLSDLVVEVEVVDVKPSVLNTTDGRFPSATELAAKAGEGHPLVGLEVSTPVEVRVVDVLAAAPGTSPPGTKTLVVTVAGGAVRGILDPTQARLLGVLEVPEGIQEGPGAEEVEVPATGPVDFTWGYAPSETLTEGGRYVLFLSRTETVRYDGSGTDLRWTVVDPAGVFEQDAEGRWRPQRSFASGPVDLSTVVSLVATSQS